MVRIFTLKYTNGIYGGGSKKVEKSYNFVAPNLWKPELLICFY